MVKESMQQIQKVECSVALEGADMVPLKMLPRCMQEMGCTLITKHYPLRYKSPVPQVTLT